jgi:hypothetical protein
MINSGTGRLCAKTIRNRKDEELVLVAALVIVGQKLFEILNKETKCQTKQ